MMAMSSLRSWQRLTTKSCMRISYFGWHRSRRAETLSCRNRVRPWTPSCSRTSTCALRGVLTLDYRISVAHRTSVSGCGVRWHTWRLAKPHPPNAMACSMTITSNKNEYAIVDVEFAYEREYGLLEHRLYLRCVELFLLTAAMHADQCRDRARLDLFHTRVCKADFGSNTTRLNHIFPFHINFEHCQVPWCGRVWIHVCQRYPCHRRCSFTLT